ncbi:MAG: TadE family protein [Actinomycetota bacterium]
MITRYLRWRRARRASGDRGLAMVEMAIVAPFLALMMAGIVEYGTMWRDNQTLSSSTRAATRVASNLGSNHLADYEAILSLNSGLSSIDGFTLEDVMIYDASAADGAPHSSCFTGSGDPQDSAGYCNHYTGAEVAAIAVLACDPSCSDFQATVGSCAGSLTWAFCPQTDRETSQTVGLTSVGVWVRINREYFTGIFPGDGVTMEDRTVMKVEPEN